MTTLSAQGLYFDAPPGWDARIFRRQAVGPESTHAVLHAGSFALPAQRGDYGSGAVERMRPLDVFLALLEFHPDSSSSPLFVREGPPPFLDPSSFSPHSLQRTLPGQAGMQAFFSRTGRAFCLYVVLGSYAARARLVARATEALGRLRIEAS